MFSKLKVVLAVSILLSLNSFVESVENSIVPLAESVQIRANIDARKYSTCQYKEIISALARKDESIRLMTYNVLFPLHDHELPSIHHWPQRISRIVELIAEMQPDIIGVQELMHSQLMDLLPHLSNAYAFFSREGKDGELNGFFYRKNRFELIETRVWGKALTMLQLRDQKTNKSFAVFNTHLAFGNVNKRESQARFIAEAIDPYARRMPVALVGDMNTFPQRPELSALPFLDGDYIQRIFTRGELEDARDVSVLGHIGPLSTFTNSPPETNAFSGMGTPGVFLDHIYVNSRVTVLLHAVEPGTVDGHYPSDHMPVFVDCVIN